MQPVNMIDLNQDQYQMGGEAMRSLAHLIRGDKIPECAYIPNRIASVNDET